MTVLRKSTSMQGEPSENAGSRMPIARCFRMYVNEYIQDDGRFHTIRPDKRPLFRIPVGHAVESPNFGI